jgi:hypothetical protein
MLKIIIVSSIANYSVFGNLLINMEKCYAFIFYLYFAHLFCKFTIKFVKAICGLIDLMVNLLISYRR